MRRWLVVVTLLVGVGVAAAFTPGNSWSRQPGRGEHQQER
jgi:hypothetical protein